LILRETGHSSDMTGAVSRTHWVGGLAVVVVLGLGVWLFRRGPEPLSDRETSAEGSGRRPWARTDPQTKAISTRIEDPLPTDPDALLDARIDYRRKLDEIRRIRRELRAQQDAAAAREPTSPMERSTVLAALERQFLPLLLDCLHSASDTIGGDDTRVVLQFHLIGEPDIGAVVDEVELVAADTRHAELTACMTESLYALRIDPPVESLELTDTISFSLSGLGDGR
jgi:hypothetical protein